MARSKLDQTQIAQLVFDDEKNANRVALVGTEISIELDAEDGDSVISKKKTDVIHLRSPKTILNMSMVEKVCLYGCDKALLKILLDNKEIHCYTLQKGEALDIFAKQVEIELVDADSAYLMVK